MNKTNIINKIKIKPEDMDDCIQELYLKQLEGSWTGNINKVIWQAAKFKRNKSKRYWDKFCDVPELIETNNNDNLLDIIEEGLNFLGSDSNFLIDKRPNNMSKFIWNKNRHNAFIKLKLYCLGEIK